MKFPSAKIIEIKNAMAEGLRGYYTEQETLSLVNWLMKHFSGHERAFLIAAPDHILEDNVIVHLETALEELKRYKPVQYITGESYFMGLTLFVDSRVMIPRPETEELVSWIMGDNTTKQGSRILDIGTGSGCIAISLAKFIPGSSLIALDINQSALEIARQNAREHKVQIDFIRVDILNPSKAFTAGRFDVIVSNPPYVRMSEKSVMHPNVLDYEPHTAIFVSDNDPLMFNRAIAEFALHNLANGGALYLEINEAFAEETVELLIVKGFSDVITRKDMKGKDRMIRAVAR
jgi:release factor glutamine methyltransferase